MVAGNEDNLYKGQHTEGEAGPSPNSKPNPNPNLPQPCDCDHAMAVTLIMIGEDAAAPRAKRARASCGECGVARHSSNSQCRTYLRNRKPLYAHKRSILLNSRSDHGQPRRLFFFGSSLERILYVIPVMAGIVSGRSRMVQKC